MKTNQTIVAFHIGRGGRNWNPGNLSFLGEKSIGEFTDDLYLNYDSKKLSEAIKSYLRQFLVESTEIFDALKLDIYNWANQGFCEDAVTERMEVFQSLTEKVDAVDIDWETIPKCYYDGNGNFIISESDANSGIGRIDIDGDYNTTHTRYLVDCDKDEIHAILDEGRHNELIETFIECNVDFDIDWKEFRSEYSSYFDIVNAYFDGVLTEEYLNENFPVVGDEE